MFSSLGMQEFQKTSRKDDLVSACYILVYLLNGGKLLGMDTDYDVDPQECFMISKQAK